jgi:predicted double-glycine peptidase
MSIKKIRLICFLSITCLLCTACANKLANQNQNSKNLDSQYTKTIANFYDLKSFSHLNILKVQGYQQTEDNTCGPSAVMSLMNYYHMLSPSQVNKTTELKIAREMGTTLEYGTKPKQMVHWLEKHGFNVKSGTNGTINMARNELNHGTPVIAEWVDWGGHWVVITGYNQQGKKMDIDKDTLFLADPAVRFDNIKYIYGLSTITPDRFASMWFDAQYFKPGHLVKGIYIIATPKHKS